MENGQNPTCNLNMQEQLTHREQEVFNLLIAGATLKEIARDLNISFDTVATHQKNLYRKLGVHSVKELFTKYLPKTETPNALLAEQPFPAGFVLELEPNPPYDWGFNFEPDLFEYKGEQHPSPFKLGKGNRLVKDEMYHVTCHFTSNVDLLFLHVAFFDNSIEEEGFFSLLSGLYRLGNTAPKANTKYSLSTGILLTRTASGMLPIENKLRLMVAVENIIENKPVLTFHKFEVVKLPYVLNQITSNQQRIESTANLSVPNPLIITLGRDENTRVVSWEYKLITPDVFQYQGKQTPSPFKLGKGNRIVEGDMFLVTCFFTSNVDIDYVQFVFIDNTTAADSYWTQLSAYHHMKNDIKANIEYDIVLKILATKTASGTTPAENMFVLQTGPNTKEQPTLTFTKFEIVKIA